MDKQQLGQNIGGIFGLKTKRPFNSAQSISVLGGYTKKRKRRTCGPQIALGNSFARNTYDEEEDSEEHNYGYPDSRSDPSHSVSQSAREPHEFSPYMFDDEASGGANHEEHQEGRDDEQLLPDVRVRNRQQKPCFLCSHFSPKSDCAIIRKMFAAFKAEFWYRSFEDLAKMLKNMYDRLILNPEMEIEGNSRGLIEYDWEDFYEHLVSPDHMGLSFEITRRKMLRSTVQDIERCERFTTFVDDEGNTRVDCRVMDTKVRLCKLLTELYKLDAKDMADYSPDAISDSSKLGAFARHS